MTKPTHLTSQQAIDLARKHVDAEFENGNVPTEVIAALNIAISQLEFMLEQYEDEDDEVYKIEDYA